MISAEGGRAESFLPPRPPSTLVIMTTHTVEDMDETVEVWLHLLDVKDLYVVLCFGGWAGDQFSREPFLVCFPVIRAVNKRNPREKVTDHPELRYRKAPKVSTNAIYLI